VVARVGQGAMKSLSHAQCLAPNCDGAAEIWIVEGFHRREKRAPGLLPMGEQLRSSDGPRLKLLLPVAPGFLAVAREEVRKAGAQVPADVPADRGNGIAATWRGRTDLTVTELGQGAFREGLVAPVLAGDGLNN